jgi:hypothetical protein
MMISDYIPQLISKDSKRNSEEIGKRATLHQLQRIYAFPANLKEAQVHAIASEFGYKCARLKSGELVPECPCCEKTVCTVQIPICYQTIWKPPELGQEVYLL